MKYRYRVLGVLFLLGVITMLDRVCISVAGQSMQKDLGLSPADWGWVLGAFAFSYGCFEIPSGAMGDRKGSRRVLARIVIWWSMFTSLTGCVTGFRQIVAVRFLFGAGEAGAFPNITTTLRRWFPVTERARAQGVVWMASRIGGALSPVLVVPLQNAFGWRVTFQIFGAVGLVWAVVWYYWFRDRPREKPSVAAEEIAEIERDGDLAVERTAIAWSAIFSQPNIWWLMLMYYCYCWCGFFYQSWFFTFLQNARGYSGADLAAYSWLPFVFGGCANLSGGFVGDWAARRYGLKWGRRAIGIGGLAISAVFTLAALLTGDKVLTVLLLALGFAASDFMLPIAWAVCLDIGGRNAGAISGAMNMAGQAGAFCSSVVFGYIVTATGNYDAPLLPMALLTGCAALLWLKIDPLQPIFQKL